MRTQINKAHATICVAVALAFGVGLYLSRDKVVNDRQQVVESSSDGKEKWRSTQRSGAEKSSFPVITRLSDIDFDQHDRLLAHETLRRYLTKSGIKTWTTSDLISFEKELLKLTAGSKERDAMISLYQCLAEENPELAIKSLEEIKRSFDQQQYVESAFWRARGDLTEMNVAALQALNQSNPRLFQILLRGGQAEVKNLDDLADYAVLSSCVTKATNNLDVISKMVGQIISDSRKAGDLPHLRQQMEAFKSNDTLLGKSIRIALYREDPVNSLTHFVDNMNKSAQGNSVAMAIDALSDGFIREDPELGMALVASDNTLDPKIKTQLVRKMVKKWLREDPMSVGPVVLQNLDGKTLEVASNEIYHYLKRMGFPDQADEWRNKN